MLKLLPRTCTIPIILEELLIANANSALVLSHLRPISNFLTWKFEEKGWWNVPLFHLLGRLPVSAIHSVHFVCPEEATSQISAATSGSGFVRIELRDHLSLQVSPGPTFDHPIHRSTRLPNLWFSSVRDASIQLFKFPRNSSNDLLSTCAPPQDSSGRPQTHAYDLPTPTAQGNPTYQIHKPEFPIHIRNLSNHVLILLIHLYCVKNRLIHNSNFQSRPPSPHISPPSNKPQRSLTLLQKTSYSPTTPPPQN